MATGPGAGSLDQAALEEWAAAAGVLADARPLFVALRGPLGAGKSTLVRAACRGAGVRGPVPSPTYTLLHDYRTRSGRTLYHADLYRLARTSELWDLSWEELVGGEASAFVEWADRAEGELPPDRWDVTLEIAEDPGLRRIEVVRRGDAPAVPPLPEPDA